MSTITAPSGYTLEAVYFYNYFGVDNGTGLDSDQVQDIYAALQEDAQRGLIRQLNVFGDYPVYIGEIELNFFRPRQADDGRSLYTYSTVSVSADMVNTILALEEAGLLSQETRDFLQERGFPLLSQDGGTPSQEADGGSQGGTAETVQTGFSGTVTAHALG